MGDSKGARKGDKAQNLSGSTIVVGLVAAVYSTRSLTRQELQLGEREENAESLSRPILPALCQKGFSTLLPSEQLRFFCSVGASASSGHPDLLVRVEALNAYS